MSRNVVVLFAEGYSDDLDDKKYEALCTGWRTIVCIDIDIDIELFRVNSVNTSDENILSCHPEHR